MRAEATGDPGPWRQRAVLGRSRWKADALYDLVRDYALETLATSDAVLVGLRASSSANWGQGERARARQRMRWPR
jgi:SRSO17 transposase